MSERNFEVVGTLSTHGIPDGFLAPNGPFISMFREANPDGHEYLVQIKVTRKEVSA